MNYQEPEKEFAVSGVVDRFEGDNIVIILKESHQIVKWPKNKISGDVVEGDVVWIHMSCDKDMTKEREKIARKILDEILKESKEEST